MGTLLALAVFVYPLLLPVATLVALLYVASSLKLGAQVVAARAAVAIPLLVAILAPGVVTEGSGAFLLPWWLHVLVGHFGVHYYAVHYLLACVALLIVLVLLRALLRPASRHPSRGS